MLRFAVDEDKALRDASIRLVTNKLFPVALLSSQIRDFAAEMLESVVVVVSKEEGEKERDPSCRVSLFMALCTADRSMLTGLMGVFVRAAEPARDCIHAEFSGLVKALGARYGRVETLQHFAGFPKGADSLVLQVVEVLSGGGVADGSAASKSLSLELLDEESRREVLGVVKSLKPAGGARSAYVSDARFVVPVIGVLEKEELSESLPRVLALEGAAVKRALKNLVTSLVRHRPPSLSPAELMVTILNFPVATLSTKQVMMASEPHPL